MPAAPSPIETRASRAPGRGSVLVVGRFHVESVADHIAETFEHLGRSVVRFDPSFRLDVSAGLVRRRIDQLRERISDITATVPALRKRFLARLLRTARDRDVAYSIVCHDFLQPAEVAALRDATGAPVVLWYPDALSNFGRSWFLNAPYDALFFKDPFIVGSMSRLLDLPLFYLPEAFNPRRYPVDSLSEEALAAFRCDVCTAGNLYAYRAAVFARLSDYDLKLWGGVPPPWMDARAIEPAIQHRYVVFEEKALAFRAARIVLNAMHFAEIYGVNARAFEVAGIGGFQLIDWRPGLAQLFADGEELVSFTTMEDLRAKLDHYLRADAEREAIARRGRERALRDHTFEHRLATIEATLAGSAMGFPLPSIEMRAL